MKPEIKIKEWALASFRGEKVLVGRLAEDHHRSVGQSLIAGHRVKTSPIQVMSLVEGDKYVETMNTKYILEGDSRAETIEDMYRERGVVLHDFNS